MIFTPAGKPHPPRKEVVINRCVASFTEHMNPGWQKSRHTGGSYTLLLSPCGHTVNRKISQGLPDKAKCHRCTESANGRTVVETRYDTEKLMATVETWDAETQLPVRVERSMTPEEIKYWVRD